MEKTFNTHKEFIEFVCSCFTYENKAKEGENPKHHYASKLDTPQWLIDIIIKAQCPYCMGDLVQVIVGNELRLRCKGQTNSECRNVDWHIGNVSKCKPP